VDVDVVVGATVWMSGLDVAWAVMSESSEALQVIMHVCIHYICGAAEIITHVCIHYTCVAWAILSESSEALQVIIYVCIHYICSTAGNYIFVCTLHMCCEVRPVRVV